jgi:hypothetical protein
MTHHSLGPLTEPNCKTMHYAETHHRSLGRFLWLLSLILALTGCEALPKGTRNHASAAVPRHNAVTAPRADFSGIWVLDAKLSDDVSAALEAIHHRGNALFSGFARTAEDNSGLPVGGPGSGPDRAVRHHLAARRLEIQHQDPSLVIIPDNASPRHLYTDNRGASVSALGGTGQPVGIAGWEGGVLVVETALGNDRILDRYRLLDNPRRLEVVSELPEWERPDESVQICRLYRPALARPDTVGAE